MNITFDKDKIHESSESRRPLFLRDLEKKQTFSHIRSISEIQRIINGLPRQSESAEIKLENRRDSANKEAKSLNGDPGEDSNCAG